MRACAGSFCCTLIMVCSVFSAGAGETEEKYVLAFFEMRDILDWKRFLSDLQHQGMSREVSPGNRVWGLLKPNTQKAISASLGNGILDNELKLRIVRELNDIIRRKTFYAERIWRDYKMGLRQTNLVSKLNNEKIDDANLAYLNRSLIDMVFPKVIARTMDGKFDYSLTTKSKLGAYSVFVNGFLLTSAGDIREEGIESIVKAGLNRVTVYFPTAIKIQEGQIDVTIRHGSLDIIYVLTIHTRPNQRKYQVGFALPKHLRTLPWERAEDIGQVSETDRRVIRDKVQDWVKNLESGNTAGLRRNLKTNLLAYTKAYSIILSLSIGESISQFLFYYGKFLSIQGKGRKGFKKNTNDLIVSPSPLNPRIVTVTVPDNGDIVWIQSSWTENPDSHIRNVDFRVKIIHFMKMKGKWYIYHYC